MTFETFDQSDEGTLNDQKKNDKDKDNDNDSNNTMTRLNSSHVKEHVWLFALQSIN